MAKTCEDYVRELVPELLPDDPEAAKLGTELAEEMRTRLDARGLDYAPITLQMALTTLSRDPSSPVAKRDGRQGYYLRPVAAPPEEAPDLGDSASSREPDAAQTQLGLGGQREEKFRAVYMAFEERNRAFPYRIEHRAGSRHPAGVDLWKYPDVVVLEWRQDLVDERLDLRREMLQVTQSLAEQPFSLTSVELKVEVSLSGFRQAFFQCLSNSRWAHVPCLAVAAHITDQLLADELRRLGTSYGVRVVTCGLSPEALDALPAVGDDAFADAAGQPLKDMRVLAVGERRAFLDWEHARGMSDASPDFRFLWQWISTCLERHRAYSASQARQCLDLDGVAPP